MPWLVQDPKSLIFPGVTERGDGNAGMVTGGYIKTFGTGEGGAGSAWEGRGRAGLKA